ILGGFAGTQWRHRTASLTRTPVIALPGKRSRALSVKTREQSISSGRHGQYWRIDGPDQVDRIKRKGDARVVN
ncbi:hypothetical protein SB847_21300, partial [Bacillus sp. SIMBA_026]|uniref:hypothetical protein n=1 Tax=Bacillus sp. SIMBA_026 TaxID=3085769 RepID=UPI0039797272